MKVLLFISILLLILSGCQDNHIKYENKDNIIKSLQIPIDNHHVPIINKCFHCECNT